MKMLTEAEYEALVADRTRIDCLINFCHQTGTLELEGGERVLAHIWAITAAKEDLRGTIDSLYNKVKADMS